MTIGNFGGGPQGRLMIDPPPCARSVGLRYIPPNLIWRCSQPIGSIFRAGGSCAPPHCLLKDRALRGTLPTLYAGPKGFIEAVRGRRNCQHSLFLFRSRYLDYGHVGFRFR
jgi:hypothetical protein